MKLFLRSIVILSAITVFAPFAVGQTLFYDGGDSGEFNDAGNWSTEAPNITTGTTVTGTNMVPGASNVAVIDVDINNDTVMNDIFEGINDTPLVLTLSSVTPANNVVQGLVISNYFAFLEPTGDVFLTNTSPQPLTIRGTGDSTGDFLVNGYVAFNYTGNLLVPQGTIVIGQNIFGNNGSSPGSGTLNLLSGNFSFDPATGHTTQMIVGDSQTSNGNVFAFGSAQGTVTQGSVGGVSIATTGNKLIIGYNGAKGTWNVTNGSTLQTGTQSGFTYVIQLGANGGTGGLGGTGSNGTLNIEDTSSFVLGSNTSKGDLQLGTLATGAFIGTGGGTGIINQTGTSNVFIQGTSTVEIGAALGGNGTYNMSGGTLNISGNGDFDIGAAVGATGNLNQSGGSLIAGTTSVINIGTIGTGFYNFSGGSADFQNGFDVGANGIVSQSGAGALTAENTVTLNGGSYNLYSGTATIAAGKMLVNDGTVNINGGVLSVPEDGLTGTGVINFGGGTLKLTSGAANTFTYGFSGILSAGSSTIDASTAGLTTFTFADPLTGPGGITLIGNGATTFNFASLADPANANSYLGITGIVGGVLNATGEDVANSSGLVIGDGVTAGTLNLSLDATLRYAGTVSGNGNLDVNFAGAGETLTLANSGNAVSTVNISLGDNGPNATAIPGTLQVYSGSFGTISDNGTGSGVTIGDNTLTTSGSVTFTNATYTGLTTINQQFTLTSPNLDGPVNNSGTLNITGAGITGNVTNNATGILNTTSVTGNVTNSGIFTATTDPGTVSGNLINTSTGTIIARTGLPAMPNTPDFTIGGNLTLSQGGMGGTLNVRLTGAVSDDYQAGSATLDNGVINVQVLGGGKIGMTTYQIVAAGGGVTDAGLTVSPNTALFSYTLQNTGNAEDLIVTQAPISTYAMTPNQRAVAAALDGSSSPLFSFFGSVPLAAGSTVIPAALDQLSPESLQYSRFISFENSTFLAERMNSVCADLRGGYGGLDTNAISVVTPGFDSGLGRSLGSLLAYNDPSFHQSAPNGVNYYPGGAGSSSSSSSESSPSPESSPEFSPSSQVISDSPNPYLATTNPSQSGAPRLSEFIGGDVILADLNQNQSGANAPTSKASYTAGDVTAGVSFRMTNHLAAGVLFDYNHTDAKTDNSDSKTEVDSFSPGIFATYFDHGFYVNGLFSFGYNNYTNRRVISFLNETASSNPSGEQYVGDLDFGYDFHPAKNWVVGPTLGVTYTHLDIDSFTEQGAPGAELAVQDQSADSLRSRLGGHLVYQTNTGDVLLQPNITAMWQHEYLDNSSGITSTFNDFTSSPFTIDTTAPSRDSALIGIGMTATLSNSLALYLNYLADAGASDYFAQSIIGGFKARF